MLRTSNLPAPVEAIVANYSHELVFWLNGKQVELHDPDPSTMLTDYLRDAGLTGTKVGCAQGGCGACTVMLSTRTETGPQHRAINACLRPITALADTHVTTIEGIGNVHDGMDPVQHCLAVNNGTQCGYCTPGFVMNTHAYLRQHPEPKSQEIENLYGGNLCRCTGYRPILQGMRSFTCDGKGCASSQMKCEIDPFYSPKVRGESKPVAVDQLPQNAEQKRPLYFRSGNLHWFRPTCLADAQELKQSLCEFAGTDQVRVVVGNTARAIYPSEARRYYIDLSAISELHVAESDSNGLCIGAAVSIQRLLELAQAQVDSQPADKTIGLRQLIWHGQWIAGIQVRNAGSIGGNIFIVKSHTRSGTPFPSDLLTVLGTLGATVTIASNNYSNGRRTFPIFEMPAAEELPSDALMLEFNIPFCQMGDYLKTYRIARRVQMAHPIVNAGFACHVDSSGIIEAGSMRVIFGGLTSCNCRLPKTEAALSGQRWNEKTLRRTLHVLHEEAAELIVPMEDEGFTTKYRLQLVEGFFYKFFVHMASQLNPEAVAAMNCSAGETIQRPLSQGEQHYEVHEEHDPITRPIIKREAFAQATGEVVYTRDEPLQTGGLEAIMVTSTRAHAKFAFGGPAGNRDELEKLLAENFPGFVALVTADDLPQTGQLLIGIGQDDPVFCREVVTHVGAPVCLVVADRRATAQHAAAFVQNECIQYENLPAVTSLPGAIAANSIMPMNPPGTMKQFHADVTRDGSNTNWLADSHAQLPNTNEITGTMRTGPQAHFYMETMSAIAIPGKYDQMTVINSTQNPSGDQANIARALGVTANQVTVRVEQLGGGFGGKQNRSAFTGAAAAVAARKLRKPIRLVYDRETDMQAVGKRHPYFNEYRVAFLDDGKIEAMRLHLNSDGGATNDCSFGVIKGSVMMSDGAYCIPTFRSTGTVFKTNKTSFTAMRTFGQVQPHLALEDAIEQVAHELSKKLGRTVRPEQIRRQNMYRSSDGRSGDVDATHFGQPLWFCDLREQWDRIYASSDFERRAAAVDEFNRTNRWRKRGISLLPVKYGIGFKQLPALNTSSALVNVNKADGSIVITHGGVEMGQGLHTKIAQVAARELNLPLEIIRITGNNTDAIVNTPATAASTGFDLNGGAVAKACRTLRSRLDSFMEQRIANGDGERVAQWRMNWKKSWPEIAAAAWNDRVSLSAEELYTAPHHDTSTEKYPKGRFFAYFTYSFSVAEVEIDVLTGEFAVLRMDALYDAGRSSNPAIDIGQIEGGIVQGIGFVTTEEAIYDQQGRLTTDNIWSYKPPCTKTIPIDMRISLTPQDPRRASQQEELRLLAVQSTKSATEPCLSLGNSVYFAIKHAVMDARRELTGKIDWLRLDVPATCQQIQQACGSVSDRLTLETSYPVQLPAETEIHSNAFLPSAEVIGLPAMVHSIL